MEIQPYDTSDWESCLAYAEFRQPCRYHDGFTTGYEALGGPLTDASRLDPTVTVKEMFQRLMDAERPQRAANSPRPSSS
ncbi:hypothetical protein ACIPVA_38320 [Streptomyces anulatus]